MRFNYLFILLFSVIFIPIIQAEASNNSNLFVSAENSKFDNSFSGSMIVEVVIRDQNLQDTDEGKGEPDVTINGKTLRMIQATDGNWYAYFANVDRAKIADSTVGLDGTGLDFGVFCSRDTDSSVFGISMSETDGFSVPSSIGITGFTNGDSSFSECTGSGNPSGLADLNNVVRKAKFLNTNPNVLPGQIGLVQNAWPLVQLFSFDDVTIQYNAGGNPQQVNLEYDESINISTKIDRDSYPNNAEVFLTINDFQLNQDPTDEDSWTFNIESPYTTFYQAFDNNGSDSANGTVGLVNLIPFLSNLGFEENGSLLIDLGSVMELTSNAEQPNTLVSDGTNTYSQIVTIVEEGPNSGIFDNGDHNDLSNIKILQNAPRGKTATIEYNENSLSVLTGFSTASVSVEPKLSLKNESKPLVPGNEYPIILTDTDQNLNSGFRDDLDVFRDSSIIPSLQIGNPITLEKAYDVKFFSSSTDNYNVGSNANSSVPDNNSDILNIDTSNLVNGPFEKISFNLGISASNLNSIFIDSSNSKNAGTNWLNYDFRSFENDLALNDFSDTTIELSFGTLGSSPVTIVDSGDLTSSKGFLQIDDSVIQEISSKNGAVFVVLNFDSSNDSSNIGNISDESNKQPIIFDFFSFGIVGNETVNNSIYRFELKESSDNSSEFIGSLEYAVVNQLNILDPKFIQSIKTINDEIKFIVTDRMIDEEGISISYSDLDEVGVITTTSTKSDIFTNSGVVSTSSSSFRFGQPVTVTLNDSDLNLKNDAIDVYLVNDNPNSPNVDTVGKDENILLEILFKDIRFKRCTINGVEHGGLAATGFTMTETGPSTGIFTGVFKMPSQFCDKSGTKLISTAGGSLDVKYYDARDEFGNPHIFSLLREQKSTSIGKLTSADGPKLSSTNIFKPSSGNTEEIILSGSLQNHIRGMPLEIVLVGPNGQIQNFDANLTSNGIYKTVFSINENSLLGTYKIQLSHGGSNVGIISFTVSNQDVPSWIKNTAKWWSNDQISDEDFIKSIQYLVKKGIILV